MRQISLLNYDGNTDLTLNPCRFNKGNREFMCNNIRYLIIYRKGGGSRWMASRVEPVNRSKEGGGLGRALRAPPSKLLPRTRQKLNTFNG